MTVTRFRRIHGHHQRMSIRDTSGQDQPVATSSGHARKRRQWLLGGAIAAVVVLLGSWLVASWSAGSQSFDAARVRVAAVTRGNLVRDISADGRVIAEAHDGRIALLNREGGGLCVSLTLPL